MFTQRRNRNLLEATGTTLTLIYHQTVYSLRNSHSNAIIGLLLTILQTAIFVAIFLLLYMLIGLRSSPIRGDFMLYVMSGIFTFMTHVKTVAAVANSHSIGGALGKHEPLNPAILIAAAALSTLYQQIIGGATIMILYHILMEPVSVYFFPGCLAMFLLSWFGGVCVGLVFLGIRPWSPKTTGLLTMIYQRANMIASGKMFVANSLPNIMLPWFSWNPLFHLIDQTRGFLFVNYTPQKTDYHYAIWVFIALLMIGLLINFTTRKYESISWNATV
ncbi:ABC transporter permease [Paracoccus methylarcula]|uniref:ABC transporter n=1 Tax=Paracoccus methylarcula TaxID=72022 RepID=A0A3R7Q2Y4_9RHOB|nr:ABC transporter [Paracoccus methylarcula]RNF34758.1 ABC transporter [Paracoccus methylarcula]